MAKLHGSLTRAGKVKNNTPPVEKTPTQRSKTGRCRMRQKYNKYFFAAKFSPTGKRLGPNSMLARMS